MSEMSNRIGVRYAACTWTCVILHLPQAEIGNRIGVQHEIEIKGLYTFQSKVRIQNPHS